MVCALAKITTLPGCGLNTQTHLVVVYMAMPCWRVDRRYRLPIAAAEVQWDHRFVYTHYRRAAV